MISQYGKLIQQQSTVQVRINCEKRRRHLDANRRENLKETSSLDSELTRQFIVSYQARREKERRRTINLIGIYARKYRIRATWLLALCTLILQARSFFAVLALIKVSTREMVITFRILLVLHGRRTEATREKARGRDRVKGKKYRGWGRGMLGKIIAGLLVLARKI